jgi:hypothetical protein
MHTPTILIIHTEENMKKFILYISAMAMLNAFLRQAAKPAFYFPQNAVHLFLFK